ncbi:hypothetical protein [Hymenobacter sp. 102]|uniref:hypothetical protein n=1 Tax=Hymenobacter sp. 102 TaxID=3403152 RepID=UPI003CF8D014
MRYYLRLRLHLLLRLLRELGWWRLLLLSTMLLLVLGRALLLAAASQQLVWLVPLGMGALVLSLHRHRADIGFLQLSAPLFRRWLAVEYALLSLPVVLVLLGRSRVLAALLVPIVAAAAAWAPAVNASAARKPARSLFRSVAFEWVSVGRRWWLGAGWLLLLAVAVATRTTATGPALAVVSWLFLLL